MLEVNNVNRPQGPNGERRKAMDKLARWTGTELADALELVIDFATVNLIVAGVVFLATLVIVAVFG